MSQATTEIISTARLILRTPKAGDLDVLYEKVFSDAEVMRFVFEGEPYTRERASEFFAANFDHEATGLKLCVLEERASSQIIGFSGLLECRVLGEKDYEIGFVLARSAWSKGYAQEIGRGQLDHGFSKVECTRLLAQVAPENGKSISVLENIGMVPYDGPPVQSKSRGERKLYVAYRKG